MHPEKKIRMIKAEAYSLCEELGAGFMEELYLDCLAFRLKSKGFRVLREITVPVWWKDKMIAIACQADLIVDDVVVLVRSAESITEHDKATLRTCVEMLDLQRGMILNFGEEKLKDARVQRRKIEKPAEEALPF
jgi:GxxExxY protein